MHYAVYSEPRTTAAIIGAVKRVWHRHPTRLSILNSVRHEEPTTRKDGTPGRIAVFYICEQCGSKAKQQKSPRFPQIHIDHIDPVIPCHRSLKELTWDEYLSRLFCSPDNLQAICTVCHDVKTNAERKLRRKVKS